MSTVGSRCRSTALLTGTAELIRAEPPRHGPWPPPGPAAHEWVVVDPRGDDTAGAGTAAAPYRTVAHALSVLPADGGGVLVRPGVYAEPPLATPGPGTAARPRWIRGVRVGSAPGPVLRPRLVATGASGALLTVRHSFWVVDGLELDGRDLGRRGLLVGEPLGPAVEGVTVHDCEVRDVNAPQGVRIVNARDVVVAGCTIRDNRRVVGGRPDDCHGVHVLQGTDRVLVTGNVLGGNSGDSVQVAHENEPHVPSPADPDGDLPRNVTIAGNLCHGDGENAVDLKSCRYVTVTGNRMTGYREGPRPGEPAAAVSVHYDARGVLVEANEIDDSDVGVSVEDLGSDGDPHRTLGPLVVRGNRFGTLRPGPRGPAVGVRVSQTRGVTARGQVVAHPVEITDNTFADVDGASVVLGSNGAPQVPDPLVANNAFTGTGTFVSVHTAGVTAAGACPSLVADHNQFRRPGAAAFRRDGAPVTLAAWRACHDGNSCVDP